MRLKPSLSAEEAYEMLSVAATLNWGLAEAGELHSRLRDIADAMATIGAIDVPEETEPLAGEVLTFDLEDPV